MVIGSVVGHDLEEGGKEAERYGPKLRGRVRTLMQMGGRFVWDAPRANEVI